MLCARLRSDPNIYWYFNCTGIGSPNTIIQKSLISDNSISQCALAAGSFTITEGRWASGVGQGRRLRLLGGRGDTQGEIVLGHTSARGRRACSNN